MKLGHSLDPENPDLIYCNDPTQYINAIKLKRKFPKSFLILNFRCALAYAWSNEKTGFRGNHYGS